MVERQADGNDRGTDEDDKQRVLESFPDELDERRRRLLWYDVHAVFLNAQLDVFNVVQQSWPTVTRSVHETVRTLG